MKLCWTFGLWQGIFFSRSIDFDFDLTFDISVRRVATSYIRKVLICTQNCLLRSFAKMFRQSQIIVQNPDVMTVWKKPSRSSTRINCVVGISVTSRSMAPHQSRNKTNMCYFYASAWNLFHNSTTMKSCLENQLNHPRFS